MTSLVLNGQETHWLESQKKIVGSYVLTFNMGNTKKIYRNTNSGLCRQHVHVTIFPELNSWYINEWQQYELTSGVLLKEPLFERKPGGIFHCQAKRLSSLPSAPHQLLQIYLTSWPVDTDRSTPVAYSSRLEAEKSVGERKAHASAPVRVHPRLFS